MVKKNKTRTQLLRTAAKRSRSRRRRQAYRRREQYVHEQLQYLLNPPEREDGTPREPVPVADKWTLHARILRLLRHHGYSSKLLVNLLQTSEERVDELLSGQIRAVKHEDLIRFAIALEVPVTPASAVRRAA